MKKGFDSKKYFEIQTTEILKRIDMFNNKLYLEFGGKLFDDYHASRVIPGFKPTSKLELLYKLRKKLEIILCISAKDIETHKIRADFGITYDLEVLRLIDILRNMDISVNSVVITQFVGQTSAVSFRKKLENRNVKTYTHELTKGYPTDVDVILSDEGYGANSYIETTKPLVIVTAPGPGGGKLATCLSQLYHEHKRGIKAGYAKFETFPVWDLPLKHPVNVAYEAATVDLKDTNMVDFFHLEKYGVTAINYNRDMEVFPVLKTILTKISGTSMYHSPTDMGVNMIGSCISDDKIVREHARYEIIRRYYKSLCDYKKGLIDENASNRIKVSMDELGITLDERVVIKAATEKSMKEQKPVVAIQLHNGKVITGKDTQVMTAAASCVVNAIKHLAKIKDEIHLLPPLVVGPMLKIKEDLAANDNYLLSLQDVIIGLSISAVTNPTVELALNQLSQIKTCDAHASYFIPQVDEQMLRDLKITLTTEPEYFTNKLFF